MKRDFSIRAVFETLRSGLQGYLEAQYHVRHPDLVLERKMLFEKSGSIFQEPYVEATPYYETINGYGALKVPELLKDMFDRFSKKVPSVGIFSKPFIHQEQALESFFGSDSNIIIATGTGSGKTESFLMPILGHLALETERGGKSPAMPGMRTLLLYPMNALVNDQLGRIRKMLGSNEVSDWFIANGKGRPVRFGTYTGRTPYPGQREKKKDKKQLDPLFEKFYLPNLDKPKFVAAFKDKGKWPSKDLGAFYGDVDLDPLDRYLTQDGDMELLTRHEIQKFCPDLMITNYSMLEYMLLRPIESQIFEQSKTWLHSDARNKIVLVLDEAHMYRGTTGAEVAFLIRRLRSRLQAGPEKMRCILTSASLGEGKEAESAILKFATELTGLKDFVLIRGTKEIRPAIKPWPKTVAEKLSEIRSDELFEMNIDSPAAAIELNKLATLLGKTGPQVPEKEEIQNWVFDALVGFGPFEKLISEISGKAIKFSDLAANIFPGIDAEIANRGIESLVALGTLAKRMSDGRILLPTRLHLFFRGIPGYFSCVNPKCELREHKSQSSILGKGYLEPRTQCDCAAKGRVFEILTHRDCGAAYIRVFTKNSEDIKKSAEKFLWHEPTSQVGREDVESLIEMHLLVENRIHPEMIDKVRPGFLEITTGYLQFDEPKKDLDRYLKVHLLKDMVLDESGIRKVASFGRCPCCMQGKKNSNKIMDLTTKGEAPFANLVRNQMAVQPPKFEIDDLHPNGGRKVLLFSDGRQKAARLALSIPREVEQDTFRQILLLAVKALAVLGREAVLSDQLYRGFVAMSAKHHIDFFDAEDQRKFRDHKKQYREDYAANLADFLAAIETYTPSVQYRTNLFRQLCKESYSVESTTVAYIALAKRKLEKLTQDLEKEFPGKYSLEDVDAISKMLIDEFLYDGSFDMTLPRPARAEVIPYPRDSWGHSENFRNGNQKILKDIFSINDAELRKVEEAVLKMVSEEGKDGRYLNANVISIKIRNEGETWIYCDDCSLIGALAARNRCIYCGSSKISNRIPREDDYIQARKAHWRNPLLACLDGTENPFHVTAEEHTAQLGNKDSGEIFSTTEKYELRFQDISTSDDEPSIDVLSCTTTMEVGVDIGSLVAVGLRNVPPLRENYQQRAGRAGRRGSSVSTVITFAQGGAHDSFYFNNPKDIVSGDPRHPRVKTNNLKIASRHLSAYLLQSYFHEKTKAVGGASPRLTSDLATALGGLRSFMESKTKGIPNYLEFGEWVKLHLNQASYMGEIESWISPDSVSDRKKWILAETDLLISDIAEEWESLKIDLADRPKEIDSEMLLEFLFDRGFLPKYAFPTDLASFLVEVRNANEVEVKEKPQLAISRALSEYAPGRLVVIDKKKYLSGGVTGTALSSVIDRAESLFNNKLQTYIYCKQCSYVNDPNAKVMPDKCPVCGGEVGSAEMVVPIVFNPDYEESLNGDLIEQEMTYATAAQFPVPVDEVDKNWTELSKNAKITFARDRRLVVVNKGKRGKESGFYVCEKCGKAGPKDTDFHQGAHKRPYLIQSNFRKNVGDSCQGKFRDVFLGTTFTSDLFLIHLDLKEPLRTWMGDSLTRHILEDSLRSLSEALLLGATRFLQIDPSEISAGYRFLPGKSGEMGAEIYLYDTLAGGAAYSDQIGDQLQEVIRATFEIVGKCPGNCDKSCYQCLRNYGNRLWHDSLDRSLAESFLRYLIEMEQSRFVPSILVEKQLSSLKRFFELKGYECKLLSSDQSHLAIKNGEKEILIAVAKAIFDERIVKSKVESALVLNEYFLTRNLPGQANKIEEMLK